MLRETKALASLQVILYFFFFTFPKKWVGRAMRNETLMGMAFSVTWRFHTSHVVNFLHHPPLKQNWSNGIHTYKLDLAFQRINGDNFFHTEVIFELHTNYYGTVLFHSELSILGCMSYLFRNGELTTCLSSSASTEKNLNRYAT